MATDWIIIKDVISLVLFNSQNFWIRDMSEKAPEPIVTEGP